MSFITDASNENDPISIQINSIGTISFNQTVSEFCLILGENAELDASSISVTLDVSGCGTFDVNFLNSETGILSVNCIRACSAFISDVRITNNQNQPLSLFLLYCRPVLNTN